MTETAEEVLRRFPVKEVRAIALGVNVKEGYIPSYQEIPEKHKIGQLRLELELLEWRAGKVSGIQLAPKEGIDPPLAFRHILGVLSTFAYSEEHKTAGVIFLLHEWFHSVRTPEGEELLT